MNQEDSCNDYTRDLNVSTRDLNDPSSQSVWLQLVIWLYSTLIAVTAMWIEVDSKRVNTTLGYILSIRISISLRNGDDKFYSKHTFSASDECKLYIIINSLIVCTCDGTTTTTSERDDSISPLPRPRLCCFRWWVARCCDSPISPPSLWCIRWWFTVTLH